MTEEQSEDLGGLEADGYQIELVPLATRSETSSIVALQQAVKKGARKSWRLVGVAQDPVSQGVLIVWDKSGLVSG